MTYYENVINPTDLAIEILNVGKSKATDVYVDIQFPKEVIIFEKNDFPVVQKPKKPDIMENPVGKVIWPSGKPRVPKALYPFDDSIMAGNLLKSINVNKNSWIDADNNILTIKLSKLTHTRTFTLKDEIYLAPIKKGAFELSITIVCDEYQSVQELTRKVLIN